MPAEMSKRRCDIRYLAFFASTAAGAVAKLSFLELFERPTKDNVHTTNIAPISIYYITLGCATKIALK